MTYGRSFALASEDAGGATFWPAFKAELVRFRYLYGFTAFYFVLSTVLAFGFGHGDMVHPVARFAIWIPGIIAFGLFYVVFFALPRAVWEDPRPAGTALKANLARQANPRVAAGLVLFAAIAIFFGSFTTLKTLASEVVGFHADQALADIDRFLHFGADPWRLLQPALGHPVVTRIIQKVYVGGWFACLMGFCGSIIFVPALAHLRARFLTTFFLCWVVLGNILAALFMSAGPAYFGEVTGHVARFAGLLSYQSIFQGLDQASVDLQDILWQLYQHHQSGLASGISAFPSLHVAVATLYTLTAWQIDRRLGGLMTVYSAIIVTGSVHLGWHYAIDGYFSILATVFFWWLAGRITAKPGLAKA